MNEEAAEDDAEEQDEEEEPEHKDEDKDSTRAIFIADVDRDENSCRPTRENERENETLARSRTIPTEGRRR